jgi:GntR family transcriptional regulator
VAFLVDTLTSETLKPGSLERLPGSVLDFLLGAVTPQNVHGGTAMVSLDRQGLQIQRGDVLLEFVSKLYHTDGRILDHSTSHFIPGFFHFHVVRRVRS